MRNTTFSNTIWPCAIALLLLYWMGAASCSRPAQSANNKSYMPALLKEVALGQDQATVLKLRPTLYPVNNLTASPWEQFTEDLDMENITSAYYNFEKTGNKRLISIELLHKKSDAAATTFKNFGGTVSSNNSQKRERTGTASIYAIQKGNRVIFSIIDTTPKNSPNNDQ
ncbi:MAG: hypothetical protein AB8E82_12225 [Aureispira sp.]